jgi:translation initiation factor IF-2
VAAPKVRIYELAKVLGISNKELMDLLESKYGVSVKSHASSIEQDVADQVTAQYSGKTAKPEAAKAEPPKAEAPAKPQQAPPRTEPAKTEAPRAEAKPAPQVHRMPPREEGSAPRSQQPQQAPPRQGQAGQQPQRPPQSGQPGQQPRQATLIASSQQPRRPAEPPQQPVAKRPNQPKGSGPGGVKPTEKRVAPPGGHPGGGQIAARTDQPKGPVAVQDVQAKTAVEIEEDDAVLEILKPTLEEDPYSDIAKTVERHQKVEPGKTTLRKTTPEVAPVPPPAHGTPHHKGMPQRPQQQQQQPTYQKKVEEPAAPPEPEVITIEGPLSIAELAQQLRKRETELIRHLFMKGVMVTVNQTMPIEDAVALAKEFGFDAKGPDQVEVDKYTAPELKVRVATGKHLKPRAPVVSIMGHVDHGKTSLLDAIRESRNKIVDTEAGGITQSIGAYSVIKDDHKVVFIDTPGHEAFTSMRMRGAQATDIAILVVAADDGVMPQTIEAINHAKAANIPIIVAINKIDKADADPDHVLVQLAEHGLNAEKWGGDTITVEVSALQKLGLDDLLEMIILVSDLQELKADSTVPAEGVVIEARLDKGKGAVATVLVQNGTLHVGENILLNKVGGRVRALIDDFGERIKSAGPSTPVEVLGLNEVPQAGDAFIVIRNDKEFKRELQQRQVSDRDQRLTKVAAPGLTSEKEMDRKDFYLIIKGDTQGSIEAVSSSLLQLATEEVSVHVLHAGTGDVSEADVLLASASNAIIIAFNIKEESNALKAAQDRGIQIMKYDVIYHVVEEMEKLMLGLLTPETEEQELGTAEVRQLFSFGKTTIAGCYVTEGKVIRNSLSRVFRNDKEIFKGTLNNLKRFKEDAREVAAGYECGISFDRFNDLQPGDIIRLYTLKEIERTSL